MSELFPIEVGEKLSPRRAWMFDHCVGHSERPAGIFTVWTRSAPMEPFTAMGLDAALEKLAAKNGWRMWEGA